MVSVLPERAPEIANGRVVVAHLGNGCSSCALRSEFRSRPQWGSRRSMACRWTPRCGELDAGVVLQLVQRKGMPIGTVGPIVANGSDKTSSPLAGSNGKTA